ncbi:deoxyhypusine synthase / DHS34 [Leishmania donovani]|uniref:Deoxyhypusine synthase family protein n=1 Tax=Leishmania donovani TaxID=5661 RepID=A0A504XQ02_LEIDO|nr:Deoxyhypusine synthase family protein [Leishmania donovani]CAJ1992367.1 deoxyhypusine synthase / DHS34 [Leishmania donovani]VDZ48202.1 deoxyhypusine_synthase/GeneDB:LmjF.34.0330 [Leishmania donovani]
MANIAESAVLVSSASSAQAVAKLTQVRGPTSGFDKAQHIIGSYSTMGFQATNYGLARSIAQRMIRKQPPSKVYQIKDGKYVLVPPDVGEDGKTLQQEHVYPNLFMGVTANLMGTGCREAVRFLVQEGVVHRSLEASAPASADGTDDQLMFARLKREYVETYGGPPHPDEEIPRAHSFLCAIVVSGGGVEHDLRRACTAYTLHHYASEAQGHVSSTVSSEATAPPKGLQQRAEKPLGTRAAAGTAKPARFGNVEYPRQGSTGSELFDCLMRTFVQRLCARQARLRAAAMAKPIPDKYDDVCSWSVTPSEVWALCGLWLVDMLAEALGAVQSCTSRLTSGSAVGTAESVTANGKGPEADRDAHIATSASYRAEALARARTTVVYWAALQQVSLFSPSFVDGDITSYLLPTPAPAARPAHRKGGSVADENAGNSKELKRSRKASSSSSTSATAVKVKPPVVERLQVDLVRDVYSINKLAMLSKKTGMLICGGGVVKHHVCNANLMRNGADFTIILSNGQEFDGSDAGAKPEEALSWGKVRMEGAFVKVYGEVSTYLPLLLAEVFVPAVRQRRATDDAQPCRKRSSRGARPPQDVSGHSHPCLGE